MIKIDNPTHKKGNERQSGLTSYNTSRGENGLAFSDPHFLIASRHVNQN